MNIKDLLSHEDLIKLTNVKTQMKKAGKAPKQTADFGSLLGMIKQNSKGQIIKKRKTTTENRINKPKRAKKGSFKISTVKQIEKPTIEKKEESLVSKELYEETQNKRNIALVSAKAKLSPRDYDVLKEAGKLEMDTTPYELFDTTEEILSRMEEYNLVIEKGEQGLIEEATRGTAAFKHMVKATILSQADPEILDDIDKYYEEAPLYKRAEYLSATFEWLRVSYDYIKRGFETTEARQIANDLAREFRELMKR